MKTIEERVNEAVHNHYNCNYPCYSFSACIFGEGENTAYDCEECGADEFKNGYELGATEQEQITKQEMIEKACNVYADLLSAHGYNPIDVNNEVVRMKKDLEE